VTFIDLALARRLESAEAASNRSFVESRARLDPPSGACWTSIAGATALFDGPRSPLTQTFGLGLFEPPTTDGFAALERFFHERSAPVFHEISPLADTAILEILAERGYRPIELTSVMFRPIDADLHLAPRDTQAVARSIESHEKDLWTDVAVEGWSEYPELATFMREVSPVWACQEAGQMFLAEIEGRPVAAGALTLHGGVALLAGASTIPAARRQGAQWALLEARLQYARSRGCGLAMMCALPGSPSQRNAERQGFRIAYTRIKWRQSLSEK
jgi:GNAT superfamily N-acetyltransferase